jgi:hypothetical protein
MEGIQSKATFREHAIEELRQFTILTAYLYVCFAAVIYFKAAVLHAQGIAYAPLGVGIVKAAICAQFMLMGRMLHIGERFKKLPTYYSNAAQGIRLPITFGRLDARRGSYRWIDSRPKDLGVSFRDRGRHLQSDHRDNLHHVFDSYSLLCFPFAR